MANMTRFDPFGDTFDDVFRRLLRPARWEGEAAPAEVKLDVHENDKAYTVKAEIPGMKREDINVEIEGNMVSISAETKREKDVKEGDKLVRRERYVGTMARSFGLPMEVEREGATAKYVDGVLVLELPKRTGGASRKLTIA
jgi:HSP20 family protein